MKEWNNPELLSLGVENTFEEELDPQAKPENTHWCHAANNGAGGWHETDKCTHNHGGGACKDPSHQWSEAHKSSCCCIGQS